MTKIKSNTIKTHNRSAIITMDVNSKSTMLAISQQGESKTDAILTLIDLPSLKEIHVIERYDLNSIPSVAFTYTKNMLLYSKNDECVDVFDLDKFKNVDSIDARQNRKIICSKNSDKIILSGDIIEVWESGTSTKLWKEDTYKAFQICDNIDIENTNVSWDPAILRKGKFITQPAAACFFNNDQKILYAGINEPKIFMYDFNKKRSDILLSDGGFQCNELKISYDEKYLCTSNRIPAGDFVWNIATKERKALEYLNEKYDSSSAIDFHPLKNVLALGSLVGYLTLIDIDKEKVVFSESIHDMKISQLLFIEEGSAIVTSSMGGEVTVTNLSNLLK